MDITIIVSPKSVFGRLEYHPVSPFAILLAKHAGQKCLTKSQVMLWKEAGFTVQEQVIPTLG